MSAGRDDGLADNMGQIGPHHKVHLHAHGKQGRPGQKTAADPEESSQNTHDEAHSHQIEGRNLGSRNQEFHGFEQYVHGVVLIAPDTVPFHEKQAIFLF